MQIVLYYAHIITYRFIVLYLAFQYNAHAICYQSSFYKARIFTSTQLLPIT